MSQKLIYPTLIAIILDYGKKSYVSDIALYLCRLWLYLHALAKKYKFGNLWTLKRVEEPLRQQVNIEMVLLIKLWFNMSSWTQWHTVPHYVIFLFIYGFYRYVINIIVNIRVCIILTSISGGTQGSFMRLFTLSRCNQISLKPLRLDHAVMSESIVSADDMSRCSWFSLYCLIHLFPPGRFCTWCHRYHERRQAVVWNGARLGWKTWTMGQSIPRLSCQEPFWLKWSK